MTYNNKGQGILVDAKFCAGQIDAIIFDCDGVLVDVSKSYDLAIKQTTALVLQKFAKLRSIPITTEMIEGFKATGGFNDEVDVTYALILSLVAADRTKTNAKKFIAQVTNNASEKGIESVEKFLDSRKIDLSQIRKNLSYPGSHVTNPLYKTFDQIFYGPALYKKIFHKKSQFAQAGLIENDRLIVNARLLKTLERKFATKIGIVTGRGKHSISYSLGELFDEFDTEHSVFLEDEPRSLAKPNPESLIRCIKGLGAKHCLYVGDSMEDIIMANKAARLGYRTSFCGIYGTGKNPKLKRRFFEKNRASVILDSINCLPKALNLAN